MTIEEYFGTLQQSFVEIWKNHLSTGKYAAHKALNDYYDEIVEAVDKLIEDWQGIHGKTGELKNTIDTKFNEPVAYLETLKKFAKDGRSELIKDDESELSSDVDEILSIIDSTLYKLKELSEAKIKTLAEYVTEFMSQSAADNTAL